ncbi:TonB-dependent receptor [Rugamonas sp. CCM 8940]|nr:TonB-dependent receptor [Rugamonas sp. CCM 8940]
MVVASVTVNGHYDNAVGSADAASQGTVNAELIASRPALRTGELLEFVPGMIVTQHSGDGKANQYFLRGFNLDHGTDFASFVDGVPVNLRSNAHGQGYADLNFLIPELVRRIDYRKGGYFADDGDFSAAGAARIALAERLPSGLASLSLGQNGYRRGVLADSFAAARGTLLYGLELGRNDGPWQTPERMRKASAVLKYSVGDRRDGYSVSAMAYHNSWHASDQIPLRAVRAGLLDRYGAVDPSDGGASARYSLAYARHLRRDDSSSELTAYLVRSRLDLFSNFSYFLDDPLNGDQFRQSERRNMAGLDASHAWLSAGAGAIEMRNKVGVQLRYDHVEPLALYATSARQTTATLRQDRVGEASAAVYLENTSYWLPALRSVAGLRYDSYRFDVASSVAGASGRANAGRFSPKLSLILGPWRQTEYFINYGAGFHSNDARGVIPSRPADAGPEMPATAATATTPATAAPALTPLAGTRGVELGLRSELLPGLQSSLSLWRLDLASELVFGGDSGSTEPRRASRRSGIEWSNHYIAAPWLLFDLDLSASRARYRNHDPAGDYVPDALARVASFGVGVKDLGRWSGAFELRYLGPRPLVEDNSVRSHSTTLASARLSYRAGTATTVTLDAFNLFKRRASDIEYLYTSRLPGEAAAGREDIHFHPVEPRALRLTLTQRF